MVRSYVHIMTLWQPYVDNARAEELHTRQLKDGSDRLALKLAVSAKLSN